MKPNHHLRIALSCLLLCIYQIVFSQLNEPYIVRAGTGCLKVRATADASASSIDCIATGTPVTVITAVPFWREIAYGNNKHGWVAKKFLEETGGNPVVDTLAASIPANAFLTIHFVDVGQGDAIWIQTFDDGIDGNGKFEGYSIVIDGGPTSSDNNNALLPYMESQGYHGANIEALLLTHPHIDHYSGAETISRHFSINHYYDPGYPSDLTTYTAFLTAMKGSPGHPARAKHIHLGQANFGTLNWGSEIKAEVLYSWNGNPDHTLGNGNTLVNNASIVLRIQYGNHVFLFMGDAEGKERDDAAATPQFVEKILLETEPAKLKANVLKIAHHGSETSSTLPFIEAVDPEIVIVQSGRKNFNGTFLPDATTLQRYCTHNPNVKIYRTDQGDAAAHFSAAAAVDKDNIILRSNGTGTIQVQAFQHGQPFTGGACH